MVASQNVSIDRAVARKTTQQELYGIDYVPISNFYTLVDAGIAPSMIPRRSSLKRSLKRTLSSNNIFNDEINKKQKLVAPKIVRFSPKKAVKKISHLKNIPARIIAERWYSSEDYYQMKLSCKNAVRLMDNETVSSTIFDEIKETKRGLEGRTKSGARERLKYQQDAYYVVFKEQDEQRTNDSEDPYWLSVFYKECSKKSVITAMKKAKEDEDCIQEYLADTRMNELKRMDTHRVSGLINQVHLDSMGDGDRTNIAAKCA